MTLSNYIRNKGCHCVRCRAHGFMGAAILITIGVLWLLDSYHIAPFDHTGPLILLVIGCVLLVARTGSTEGHVNPPWYNAAAMPQQQNPQQWTAGPVPPPPPTNPNDNDPQVKP